MPILFPFPFSLSIPFTKQTQLKRITLILFIKISRSASVARSICQN